MQDLAVVRVGEEPQRSVRRLPHVADAKAQIGKKPFFLDDFFAVELEPIGPLDLSPVVGILLLNLVGSLIASLIRG